MIIRTSILLRIAQWERDRRSFPLLATGTHNVHLSETKGFRHREPDVSFFGAPRCVEDEDGDLVPYDDGAVPDVVIQFSWRNKRGYEEDAIDEMINDAVEIERGPKSMTCLRVGYLIKVCFKKKPTLQNALKGNNTHDMGGLDLYRLPHSTTMDDAINRNGGASKVTYVPGGSRSAHLYYRTGFGILWRSGVERVRNSNVPHIR